MTLPTLAGLGLSPLMRARAALGSAEPPLCYSYVSPDNLILARALIEKALDGLRGLSVSINVDRYDDRFVAPNAASEAVAVLSEALAALKGEKP
jgi:hypothetical protein